MLGRQGEPKNGTGPFFEHSTRKGKKERKKEDASDEQSDSIQTHGLFHPFFSTCPLNKQAEKKKKAQNKKNKRPTDPNKGS